MYQALYRKWRPRTFDEVIGQNHVTETLKNQVAQNKLSHAYLFVGSRGTGKTTCARILARAVNCLSPVDGNPCGECAACRAILSGSAPELVEIDAASNNGVDDVRSLRDEAIYSPASLKKRVYIIDEVHMLSKPAFNALLKILEEPPEHLLFILATTEINKVPATILSRCQRFSFRRISNDSIRDYLENVADKENLRLTTGAASLIAGLSEGGMRDALSLLDQCSSADTIDENYVMSVLGLSGGIAVRNLFDCICACDTGGAIKLFTELWSDGKDPSSVLRELNSFLRDILICFACGNSAEKLLSGRFDYSLLTAVANDFSISRITGMMEVIQKHLSSMRDSVNSRQIAELCLVSLCLNAAGTVDTDFVPAETPNIRSIANAEVMKVKATKADNEIPKASVQPASACVKASDAVTDISSAPSDGEEGAAEKETDKEYVPGWNEIIDVIAPVLPNHIKSTIREEEKIRGELNGNVLNITVNESFLYGRVSNTNVTQAIEKALEEKYHRQFRVLVSERSEEKEAPRDINELRKYDIVKFE